MQNITERITAEIKKVIIGKDEAILKVWSAILAQGHVLLEDVPGVGKTTMALAYAKTLGLDVRRIQFTPDTMPSDIIGFSVYENGGLKYQDGAVMTNLLLADEINRTSSKTQSALLEAMEEKKITVDGFTKPLPEPFVVLATQNPVGSAGTMNLPNSQLDRFMIRMHMGYPDKKSQVDLMMDRAVENPLDKVQAVLTREELLELIEEVKNIHMAESLYYDIAAICEATRQHPMIRLGVSPRASLALCRFVKATAYVNGRDYVLPDDVRACVPDVFAHRLVLSSKARLNDYTEESLLEEILEAIPLPELSEKTL